MISDWLHYFLMIVGMILILVGMFDLTETKIGYYSPIMTNGLIMLMSGYIVTELRKRR